MPCTALIVAVPEAEPFVGDLRARYDWSAARGVPAHVTVLYPFAPLAEIDQDALAVVVAGHDAFAFTLAAVRRFPEQVTYLAPEPAEPFLALMDAVWKRWPGYPPYGGEHETVVPHLTVSDTHIELELPRPIDAHAHEVTLIEETEPDGRWVRRAAFALRSARA